MFEVGDRVAAVTDDYLNGKLGTVAEDYPGYDKGVGVVLDEDVEADRTALVLLFLNSELRKVDA